MTLMPPDRFALLADLPADALMRLGLTDAPTIVPAGAQLFRQGDISTGLFLIDAGEVHLIGRTPGDGEVTLARSGPGDVVGEFSLLDGGVRSATAIARTQVTARRIGLDHFGALLSTGDTLALAIVERLRAEVARRTRATLDAIANALISVQAGGLGTARPVGTGVLPSGGPAQGLATLLHSFPGFDRLSSEEWPELEEHCRLVPAARGTLIGAAGNPCDALLIVARGAVRVGIAHPAGGMDQLLIHGPGSFSGAAAMLDPQLTVFVRDVREDAVLVMIDRAGFDALRAGARPLGRKIFAAIGLQMVRDLRRLSRLLGRLRGDAG